MPKRSLITRAERDVLERDVVRAERASGARDRSPTGSRSRARPRPRRQRLDRGDDRLEQLLLRARRRRHLVALVHAPLVVDRPGQDLRAAEVDADDALGGSQAAATIPGRMADGEKPYRVYKGGRAKGKVPTAHPPGAPSGRAEDRRAKPAGPPALAAPDRARGPAARRAPRRLARRELPLVPSGVADANERLPKAVAADSRQQDGAALEAVADPAARHRRRQDRGARRRAPLRLDPARPHRPRSGTGSRTSRSRATSASTSPATARTRSTPRSSSAGPR